MKIGKWMIILWTALTLCACSINQVKQPVIDTIKTTMTAKNKVITSILPSGDQSVTIGDQTLTVKSETISQIKEIINTDTAIKSGILDFLGEQITDENIATIAYYAEKLHVDVKSLMSLLGGLE